MKKIFSVKYSANSFSLAMLVLRLSAGLLIVVRYGIDKLFHFTSLAQRFPDPFHIGAATSLALVVFAELCCGSFVILGLFTRLACIPLIIVLVVALIHVHKGQVFGTGENAGLFLACFLAILLTGPGSISMDRLISK